MGGWALSQLWLFWLAPFVGAVSAAVVYRWLAAADAEEELAHEAAAALA